MLWKGLWGGSVSASRRKAALIVVGGGHAGVEAAAAAARLHENVVLVTMTAGRIGELSCNPAIGGVAKGTLVREIAALGGVMPSSADTAEIQFRMLNVKKGPAVWGPRKQEDLSLYMLSQSRRLLEEGVHVLEAEVLGLEGGGNRITGVITSRGRLKADAVVLATGTFLGGRLYRGQERWSGGRIGDRASNSLEADLRARMFHVKRFKTGTPPRLVASTVDSSSMRPQPEDGAGFYFGFRRRAGRAGTGRCWITHTNERTAAAARRGMLHSPLIGGDIGGAGPRYCPSFEDKVVKFPQRKGHRVFVEPMGMRSRLVYPSGISTSLSRRTQMEMLATIPGLEKVEVASFGYAVEYCWMDRGEYDGTLRARGVENLFFAGQICGTSGYEEAAALGLLAGANAARVAAGDEAVRPSRMESYLGVMVDDLVEEGTREPYRLFSSRSENRMHIRQDNAPERMAKLHKALFGSVPEWMSERLGNGTEVEKLLRSRSHQGMRLEVLARRTGMCARDLMGMVPELARYPEEVVSSRVLDLKYQGYISRAHARRKRIERMNGVSLAGVDDYMEIELITMEARQALNRERPATLGEAGRMPEIRPSDLEGLMIHLFEGRST